MFGQFTVEPAIPVQVKVVDSTGRPLEGMPVRKVRVSSNGARHWDIPHITDAEGIATFYAVPNSAGHFGILCETDNQLSEIIDYEIGAPEQAGRQYVLRISDELAARLLQ